MSDSTISSTGNAALEHALSTMMESGIDQMRNDDGQNDGKTKKLFGLFDVPVTLATIVEVGWQAVSQEFTHSLRPISEKFYTAAGEKVGLKGQGLARGVATGVLMTSTAVRSVPYINPIFEGLHSQHEKRRQLARRISPVLDELKGNHSVGTLMGIGAAQNEMIYAHRRRLATQADTENMNNVVTLITTTLPGLLTTDLPVFGHHWSGKEGPYKAMEREGLAGMGQRLGGNMAQLGAPALATYINNTNTRKLKKRFSSEHSALEMVLALEEQVEHGAKADSFKLPDGEAISLEEYVGAIMIQHQKDMADLDSGYTELRPALKEDIAAVAKPIAEAIRDGDMSVLSLIRLVGEGQIIKHQGRAIRSPEQVAAMIRHDVPKKHTFTTVDAKEFYKNASFTQDDLKTALGNLKGEERDIFASMFPDSILEEAGMPRPEIETMREQMLQRYEHHLAEVVSGAAAKTDDELKKEGLSTEEIKKLRDAASMLSEKGEKAIHELKSEGTNAGGIEQSIANLAVTQVSGNKAYFGTLLSKGQNALKSIADGTAEPAEKPENPEKTSHADRVDEERAEAAEKTAERA